MANYPQEVAQNAVCQSHTGHMTGLWFLPSLAFKAEYYWANEVYIIRFRKEMRREFIELEQEEWSTDRQTDRHTVWIEKNSGGGDEKE